MVGGIVIFLGGLSLIFLAVFTFGSTDAEVRGGAAVLGMLGLVVLLMGVGTIDTAIERRRPKEERKEERE